MHGYIKIILLQVIFGKNSQKKPLFVKPIFDLFRTTDCTLIIYLGFSYRVLKHHRTKH